MIMKKTLLILMAMVGMTALQATADVNRYAVNDGMNDIALVYYGGSNRLKWNQNQISHLVTHTFKDGHTEWLFPAFLYLEFRVYGTEVTLAPGYAKEPATKEHWEWLANRYFSRGEGLDALDKAIDGAKRKLGEPPFKHKVILCLPTPMREQRSWGRVSSRNLRFDRGNDRLEALYWFVDLLVNKFKAQHYRNIELDGLYWLDEDMLAGGELFPALNNYIHAKGLKAYWIPYFTAPGRDLWQSYGFDYAYLQPNYFFNYNVPRSRLDETCALAKRWGLGLELEFDEKHFDKRSQYGNRLSEYIDAFENNKVFDQSAMAYYLGNDAFLRLSQSRVSSDVQLIDRLCNLIVKRNVGNNTYMSPSQSPSNGNNNSNNNNNNNNNNNKSQYKWTDPEYWHF